MLPITKKMQNIIAKVARNSVKMALKWPFLSKKGHKSKKFQYNGPKIYLLYEHIYTEVILIKKILPNTKKMQNIIEKVASNSVEIALKWSFLTKKAVNLKNFNIMD